MKTKLIILGLVVLILGGMSFWIKNNPKIESVQNQTNMIPNNWKTYTNEKYGFQIQYSPDDELSFWDSSGKEYSTSTSYQINADSIDVGRVRIQITETEAGFSIEDKIKSLNEAESYPNQFTEKGNSPSTISKVIRTTVGGLEAVDYTEHFMGDTIRSVVTYRKMPSSSKIYVYNFFVYLGPNYTQSDRMTNEEANKNLERIISTFKFTK